MPRTPTKDLIRIAVFGFVGTVALTLFLAESIKNGTTAPALILTILAGAGGLYLLIDAIRRSL
jgi:hypothetical protein